MRPVLVLQHLDDGGPAYFGEFLERRGIPIEVRRPDRGDPLPVSNPDRYSGICFCGGTQSVTAPEPWMHDEIALIRSAAGHGTPVIGHCLGGQLISRAFGGTVSVQASPEFGWQRLERVPGPGADGWLDGAPASLTCLQWHDDAFTLPPGAVPLLRGEHCEQQAFAMGNMLAMQFHVEATAETARYWGTALAHLVPPPGPGVQHAGEMLSGIESHLPRSLALADALYSRWLEQVA